jgi:hypothetical protein
VREHRLDVITPEDHAVIMIRTQVSLDEEAYRAAQDEAARQGISFAELCRRAIGRFLAVSSSSGGDDRGRKARPWMRFAGSLESGDADASRTVDAVVYGSRRR